MKNVVVLVAACAFIVGLSYGMHSPIVPVFAKEELSADFSQVGLIGMANYLPYMFAPVFVGMMLDRVNKAYILAAGILINVFSIFMLSAVNSAPEAMLFRGLAGIAHALFWPASEVILSTNSSAEKRVKWIAVFTAAWVAGFMTGPLAGKVVLDSFDYRVLFQLSSFAVAAALIPALLLVKSGRPMEHLHRLVSIQQIRKEISTMPDIGAIILYYAITFGVTLAIYPAYMKTASITDQNIELLFFIFGLARFGTLFFVQKVSRSGNAALALAAALTAAGMFLSYAFASLLSFAVALVLIGIGVSIFYPVTFNAVTRNVPAERMGSRLGIFEALFGVGWTAGPIIVGVSSDAFGPSSPYLAFFIVGVGLAGAMLVRNRK